MSGDAANWLGMKVYLAAPLGAKVAPAWGFVRK